MDDIEKRMEEIRATAESIDSGGISEGTDPQAWIYRKDVIWLLTQLAASRRECERLRGLLGGFPRPPLCINSPDDEEVTQCRE